MEYSHEIILPNDDFPFKMFIFEGSQDGYIRQKHWHRSIEIFAVFDGEMEFYLNDEKYPLHPGEFMLVNSNELHSIYAPKKNETLVIQIPLATFERYYTDDGFIYFSHSSRIQDEEVMGLFEEMYRVYAEKKAGYDYKVQSLYYRLLYLLVSKYRKTDMDAEKIRANKKLNKLSTITDYMKQNYSKELSLERLARIFNYSPTYLSRMFRKYAQMSYKTYLDDLRLRHAYNDLVNTDLSIGMIAEKNGFAGSKALARVFKEQYGVLPSEYRKVNYE